MFGDERARPKEISLFFLCGFNVKAERFPRQRNWRRTCECAVIPPPTFVNLVTIGSLTTHQILAKLINRILRYGGGLHVRTCTPISVSQDPSGRGDCTFARASPVSLSRKPLSPDIEATPKTNLPISFALARSSPNMAS